MFGSVVLEVGIGLVFTFLLFSIILTSVREGVESWLKQRSKDLEATIMELLTADGADQAKALAAFYNHPLIFSLFPQNYAPKADRTRTKVKSAILGLRRRLPTYISSEQFAAAIIDLKKNAADIAQDSTDVVNLLPTKARDRIDAVVKSARAWGLSEKATLEKWYDGTMERLSGQFKRKTQRWLFLIGLAIAIVANVNPIIIANRLAHDSKLRDDIVAVAPQMQSELCKTDAASCAITKQLGAQVEQQLAVDALPVGWCIPELPTCVDWAKPWKWWYVLPYPASHEWSAPPSTSVISRAKPPESARASTLTLLFGWLITAFAGMLGAPFWFDILKSVMNIRSSINPDEEAAKKAKVQTTTVHLHTP